MPTSRAGASHDQPGAPIINQVQLCFRGRMRFVFRHFPMTEVHPHSEIAAESAEFAGRAILGYARRPLRKPEQAEHHDDFSDRTRARSLQNAVETDQYTNRVRSDFMDGLRSGVMARRLFLSKGARHGGAYNYASPVSGHQMRLAGDTSA